MNVPKGKVKQEDIDNTSKLKLFSPSDVPPLWDRFGLEAPLEQVQRWTGLKRRVRIEEKLQDEPPALDLPGQDKPTESSHEDISNPTFWERHAITKEMVTKALNVCHQTYDNTWDAINPSKLPEPNAIQRRMVIGKTRCVLQYYPSDGTLYIGFRGSADKRDWLSNIQFELVSLIDGDNDGDVKVHKGFKERASVHTGTYAL